MDARSGAADGATGKRRQRADRRGAPRAAGPGRLLTRRVARQPGSIADAVVAKNGPVYFLTDPSGRIPIGYAHGYGLYYHDCRFLDGYELRIGRDRPDVLAACSGEGFATEFQLTNGAIDLSDGTHVPKERVGIRWTRVVDGPGLALRETLAFTNYGVEPLELPLALHFSATFEDLFVVRGMKARRTVSPPRRSWAERDLLAFVYDGADHIRRTLAIRFDPPPQAGRNATARWRLALAPQRETTLQVTFELAESGRGAHRADPQAGEPNPAGSAASGSPAGDRAGGRPAGQRAVVAAAARAEDGRPLPRPATRAADLQAAADRWLEESAGVHTDQPRLDRLLRRSLLDLRMLRTVLDGRHYFAAGVPWYVTLFGRDSIISALQMLAFDPDVAADTLRLLARLQGTRTDEWRLEQPGKIPHELRVGELANEGAIPYTPFYGSIDATPLWLILLGRHAAWTGSLDLFRELRDHADAALAWLERYGDVDGDGFLEYDCGPTADGIVNQGWKDSDDGIVNADGSIARPPIALVEVQGYAWRARIELADLFARDGQPERAAGLRRTADALRDRFEREFWLPDRGTYALALQRDHEPCAVVSSNPGHALWTGIVAEERAPAVRASLLGHDMFSGWGIRTLSRRERRYNPVGYHLGTVWPHDNAFTAAGFRRYGLDDDALRIFDAMAAAAGRFHQGRLPELFAGFSPEGFAQPVHYPVACHPQAWAAGSVPFLLAELLGLEPDAFAGTLRVRRPHLPTGVDRLDLERLRLGEARVSLRFLRSRDTVHVETLGQEGDLRIETSD